MKSYQYKGWVLSKKFDHGRYLLGRYCWNTPGNGVSDSLSSLTGAKPYCQIATFETREQAREAQKTCYYKKTRVEKVCITVEIVK